MSTAQLIRRGGLALFLGGVLWGGSEVGFGLLVGTADPLEYPQPAATILWLGLLAATVFTLLGLPAMYAAQAERAGGLGLIGFVVVFAGTALVVGITWFGSFIQAAVAELIVASEAAGAVVEEPVMAGVGMMASLGLYLLGWILFGVASLRAGVLPRWPVALAMLAPVFWLLSEALDDLVVPLSVISSIGVAWLGVVLWRREWTVGSTTPAPSDTPPVRDPA
jgi:hypothetical protein